MTEFKIQQDKDTTARAADYDIQKEEPVQKVRGIKRVKCQENTRDIECKIPSNFRSNKILLEKNF